jgi:hypothetical protein
MIFPKAVNNKGMGTGMVLVMNAAGAEKEFSTLFAEAVSSTLREILGETASTALIYHLEIRRDSPDATPLHGNLGRVVGTASGIVEKLISRKLAKALGLALDETQPFDFVGSVEHLRKEFTKARGSVP